MYPGTHVLISLWKTATDLDRLGELLRVTAESYALAITATAQYAVEIEHSQAEEFREHLQVLAKTLRAATKTDDVRIVEASFRGELRDYRDLSQRQLTKLRQEVGAAAAAVHALAENVAANGSDHEKELELELCKLDRAARLDDPNAVRDSIFAAISSIASSLDQMRRANRLVVAQLQNEIRLLHQAMQSERQSLFTDRASGAWNRQKLTGRIEELLQRDEPFCVLMIALRNFKRLDGRYSRTVVENVLSALVSRFHSILGPESPIGRWSEDQFAAILPMQPANAMALSREVTQKLSGNYSVQENGLAQSIAIQVTAGIAERRAGTEAAKYYRKLEQLAVVINEN
jgi:GGDEF domain-containing protein